WHKYEPPRNTPDSLPDVNFEAVHSHTLPVMLYSPYPFGAKDVTGTVPTEPSGFSGNVPTNVFIRATPSGSRILPHGNGCCFKPPRAANSHSVSVSKRPPAQSA